MKFLNLLFNRTEVNALERMLSGLLVWCLKIDKGIRELRKSAREIAQLTGKTRVLDHLTDLEIRELGGWLTRADKSKLLALQGRKVLTEKGLSLLSRVESVAHQKVMRLNELAEIEDLFGK